MIQVVMMMTVMMITKKMEMKKMMMMVNLWIDIMWSVFYGSDATPLLSNVLPLLLLTLLLYHLSSSYQPPCSWNLSFPVLSVLVFLRLCYDTQSIWYYTFLFLVLSFLLSSYPPSCPFSYLPFLHPSSLPYPLYLPPSLLPTISSISPFLILSSTFSLPLARYFRHSISPTLSLTLL